ncbi:MAG: peptidoglycan DD-metalloendopeptidase family protein [Burkholderiales bacterium]
MTLPATPASSTTPSAILIAATAILLVVSGCATRTPAPVVDRPAVPARDAAPAAPAPAAPPPVAVAPESPRTPEPDWRPPSYTVKRGDTLYQIALEYGLDYRELAAWNSIENVNLIRVGQVLRLVAPGSEPPPTAQAAGGATGTIVTPLRTVPPVGATPATPGSSPAVTTPAPPVGRAADGAIRTSPRAIKEPWSDQAMKDVARASGGSDTGTVLPKAEPSPRPAPTPAAPPVSAAPSSSSPPATGSSPGDDEGLDWVWPAKGKVVAQFSETASLKGIDISGAAGDAVVASASGKVVYAGTGLRGYGKLVIVKHNNTYLTAYAHNREILVKEGQSVSRGQKIAEMGSSDADQVKLHFEIRRLGRPMDPLRFLPPA